jgi:hypothetical protein
LGTGQGGVSGRVQVQPELQLDGGATIDWDDHAEWLGCLQNMPLPVAVLRRLIYARLQGVFAADCRRAWHVLLGIHDVVLDGRIAARRGSPPVASDAAELAAFLRSELCRPTASAAPPGDHPERLEQEQTQSLRHLLQQHFYLRVDEYRVLTSRPAVFSPADMAAFNDAIAKYQLSDELIYTDHPVACWEQVGAYYDNVGGPFEVTRERYFSHCSMAYDTTTIPGSNQG